MLAHLLNEMLIHGRDMACRIGRPRAAMIGALRV